MESYLKGPYEQWDFLSNYFNTLYIALFKNIEDVSMFIIRKINNAIFQCGTSRYFYLSNLLGKKNIVLSLNRITNTVES